MMKKLLVLFVFCGILSNLVACEAGAAAGNDAAAELTGPKSDAAVADVTQQLKELETAGTTTKEGDAAQGEEDDNDDAEEAAEGDNGDHEEKETDDKTQE